MTTTYIDGLFEQAYDNVKDDWTYRHYILAGGARVGVETIVANSGGTVTSDTLSFYVRDEVGSVIATITENLGGVNQAVALTSYDAWGKARPTSGGSAYQDPAPGTCYSPTPTGQEEGYAGHDNLADTGLVDMEGRVYDPEVGRFLSPDPNVQYPFSSQGYDRYSYVNNNPLSLSDPSGYFSLGGYLTTGDPLAGFFPQQYGEAIGIAGPLVGAALNAIPYCEGWCDAVVTGVSEAEVGYLESGSVSEGMQQGVLAGAEAFAFDYVGGEFGTNPVGGELIGRSMVEGLIGGAFSEAGGGQFSDGFLGAFVSSESSGLIAMIGGTPDNYPVYFSASNRAVRAAAAAIVGGMAARVTGGNFTEGALSAAFQQIFNDQHEYKSYERESEEERASTWSYFEKHYAIIYAKALSARVEQVPEFEVDEDPSEAGLMGLLELGEHAVNDLEQQHDLFVYQLGEGSLSAYRAAPPFGNWRPTVYGAWSTVSWQLYDFRSTIEMTVDFYYWIHDMVSQRPPECSLHGGC